MAIEELELKLVRDAVRRTINKFREHPCLFFTESDIHSYFYGCLYGKRMEVRTRDGLLTSCLHREYPTNFRFDKISMTDYGLTKRADRGHHDLVVLNPKFIQENDIRNVVNKNVKDVEDRSKHADEFWKEIIAVIEFKYIINNNKNYIAEFEKDAMKLSFGRKYQDFKAYNLAFCNHKYFYLDELKDKVEKTSSEILSMLVISYFEGSRKIAPKVVANQRINFLSWMMLGIGTLPKLFFVFTGCFWPINVQILLTYAGGVLCSGHISSACEHQRRR